MSPAGAGSSAAASFVASRWRGLEAGPDPAEGRAGSERRRDSWAERGGESHPGPSFLSGEKTFLGKTGNFSLRALSGEEASCGCARLEVTHPWDPKEVGGEVPRRGRSRRLSNDTGTPGTIAGARGLGAWGKRHIWGQPVGTAAALRIHAAGRRRGPDSRPFPRSRIRVGEAPLWDGMRDAADRGPRLRAKGSKKKCACLSVSFSLGLRGKFEELPHSGAGKVRLFLPAPLSGGRRGEERQPRCPRAAHPAAEGWGAARGRPGRGPRRSAPAASSFGFIFPARPALGWAFPCAPTVRAACSRRTGGAPEPRPPRLRPSLPGASSRGGRPGSELVVYLQTALQESARGCLPGRQ